MLTSLWCIFCSIFALFTLQADGSLFRHRHHSRKPVRIGQALYHKIHIYTTYASASYRHHCPHPPFNATILNYINIKKTSTQAVLYKNHERKELIMAFPGTRGPIDSKIDSLGRLVPYRTPGVTRKNCRRCRVHKGFQIAWNSIAEDARHALDHALKKNPNYRIILTGHSLGGAIASLATGSLRSSGYPVKASYTFGQPRTGNVHYADFIDHLNGVKNGSRGHFHRVTHTYDGVPQVPRERLGGYHHHSTEYWERNDKSHSQDAHQTFRCFGQEPTNCNESTHPKGVINHAHGFYSGVNMGNAYICENK